MARSQRQALWAAQARHRHRAGRDRTGAGHVGRMLRVARPVGPRVGLGPVVCVAGPAVRPGDHAWLGCPVHAWHDPGCFRLAPAVGPGRVLVVALVRSDPPMAWDPVALVLCMGRLAWVQASRLLREP